MVDIRVMGEGDFEYALSLMDAEGWVYSIDDMKRLLKYSPDGCFIASLRGKDIGMVSTTPYGAQAGFIGCLVVDRESRGNGLGERILDHAIDHLHNKGIQEIYLEAMPRAVSLYRRKGFSSLWQSIRLLGMELNRQMAEGPEPMDTGFHLKPPVELPPVCQCTPDDLKSLVELDQSLTGMDRSKVLYTLMSEFPDSTFATGENGRITGFLMLRPAVRGYRLGPWICEPGNGSIPRALLGTVRERFGWEKLFVGLPATNTVGIDLLKRHGFIDGITCQRMVLGGRQGRVDPRAVFGITSAEKG